MPDEEKVCVHCGIAHKPMFSEETLAIYEKLGTATVASEREHLMINLANSFATEHSPLDLATDEVTHDLLEELDEARAKYERSAFRIARLLMQSIPIYSRRHAPIPEKVVVVALEPKTDANKAN